MMSVTGIPSQATGSKVASAQIDAVVIRADGRREDLGTIAFYHRNPLRLLAWKLSRQLRAASEALNRFAQGR